jgi:hypothetical protein
LAAASAELRELEAIYKKPNTARRRAARIDAVRARQNANPEAIHRPALVWGIYRTMASDRRDAAQSRRPRHHQNAIGRGPFHIKGFMAKTLYLD